MRFHTEIDAVAKDASQLLGGSKSKGGTPLAQQLPKAKKRLSRKERKAAQKIAQIEQRAKYLPYVPAHEQKEMHKARAVLESHANSKVSAKEAKEGRSKARRQWVRDLTFNVGLAIGVLALFWWIGTS